MERYFLIADLGSNSVRMDIIGLQKNGLYRVAKRVRLSCRLSEGLAERNLLQTAAIERTINVLHRLREIADEFPLICEYAVATEALRRAQNREVFLRRAKEETGFSFVIIDGRQEAYYDYLGVIRSMSLENFILLDTGGGSSELVLVKNQKIVDVCCVPFGSITLTEQFAKGTSMSREDYDRASRYVCKKWEQISWLEKGKGLAVVGLGGSIRTMVKIHQKKEGNDLPLHGYRIFVHDVVQFRDEMLQMNHQQRKEIAGMDPLRADIITAGILPLDTLMRTIESPFLLASAYGLREGLCYEKCQEILEQGKLNSLFQ